MSATHSHFMFLESGRSLQGEIQGYFDPVLVNLSILVACMATYTAFLLSERIRASESRWHRLFWLMTGSIALGMGIWAMHFTGMLAFELPVTVLYDKLTTLISIIPAVFASAVVFFVGIKRSPYRWCLPLQSVLMGSGIGLMHYIGMAAMRMDAIMRYEPMLFGLSILVAVILSYLSLRLKLWAESPELRTMSEIKALMIAAVVMGCAISAMHYIGMASVYHFPLLADVTTTNGVSAWAPESVSNLLVYIVLMLLLLLIAVVHLSRRLELLHKLQDSETRLASIVENMVDGLIVIDDRGIIDSFNPAAEKIFAHRADEVIGKNVSILMDVTEQAQHGNHLLRYKQGGPSRVIGIGRDIEGRRKDGILFPMDLALNAIVVDGKRKFIGVVRDISDRKQAENNILEAKRLAEKASMAKSEFLNRVSHELRTPMNAIIGFGQLLGDDSKAFSGEHQDYLRELQSASSRLLDLIDGMLDLSRIETDKLEVSMDAVLLHDVTHACLVEIGPKAQQRQITIDNLIDKHDHLVMADVGRLQQVLRHLLSNAVMHNREGGQVSVTCELVETDRLRISVSDTGLGLSEEQQQELYKPFGRLNTDERLSGTGIGLAISKHLMQLMGGTIGVDSKLGEGSTFWIELERGSENGKREAK